MPAHAAPACGTGNMTQARALSCSYLLGHLPARSAVAAPASLALSDAQGRLSYAELDAAITACAHGLLHLGLQRGKRVGIYLDKRRESVIAAFGAARAGGVFVPINPLLKPSQ